MSKSRSGAPRRVAAGLLAGALTVFGLALAAPAGAAETVTNDRVAGADRFGTAAAACTEAYADGTDTVIIATARNFPDALAASSIAGENDACILMVEVDSVPEATVAAIDELGASNAIIVGGTAAVSQDVIDFLENEVGIATSRVAGDDRFETAAAIGGALSGICDLEDSGPTAILASGRSSADALAAGPIAFAGDGTNPCPILLTEQNELPQSTADAIADLGITNIIVVGGTGVISEAVRDEAGSLAGDDDVTVLAGTDRNKTAVAIAEFEVSELGWAPTTVCLANSRQPGVAEGPDFGPDALTGGPLCGLRQAPILLVVTADDLGADSEGFLDDHSDTITELLILGGTAVISDIAEGDAVTAAETVDNDTPTGDVSLTNAPELIDLEFVNLTSTGGSAGVGQLLVKAVFDEPVLATPIVQTGFKLWTPYGESQNSNQAQLDSEDPSKVSVVFDVFGGSSFAAIEGTLFTVVANTVQDSDGKVNPEGDLPGFIDQTFAAGITRNPDLTAVAVQTANTVYDFTFDSAVQILNTGSFRIVDTDGAVRTSTGATIVASTTPANTVVRASFAAPAANQTGVRGVALEGAVAASTVAAMTNPQQAADVSGSTGLSDSPDLVSITLDMVNDRITFTFDENIDSATTPIVRTGFHVYYRQAGGAANDQTSTGSTDRSASDPRSVIAQFPAGAVNEFVAGAYVDDGAVDRDGATAKPNRVDEEGVGSTFAAGAYLGPELVSAASTNNTDVFGNVTGRKVTYTWDETVTLTNAAGFFVTDSDGNRTNLTGCVLGSGTGTVPANSTTVTCTITATTGAVFTEIGDSELATVAASAVTGTKVRSRAGSTNEIVNHEERAAAPGTARDVAPAA